MLKKFVPLFAGLALLSGSALAAIPLQMNVQGSLLNADGSPVNGTYSIAFALYSGSGAGAPVVWTETIADVGASGGVFDELLGAAATPLQTSVFTGTSQLWLGIRVLSGPGVPVGGEAELPRKPLTSVAYAMESGHAVSATNATSLTCTNCVALTSLGFDVATQAELDAATALPATSALDLQCTSCVATTELGFDVATQAELDAAVTTVNSAITAAAGAATTALNGAVSTLDGKIAAGDNALDARLDLLEPKVATLESDMAAAKGSVTALQAEVTLSDLACTNGQMAVSSGNGVWACAAVPSSQNPGAACTGDQKALQWTGTAWSCVTLSKTGLSTGQAKGFEARDSSGFVWDGIERQAGTWSVASADCISRGGRLPTITELWRVSGGKNSEVGNTYETNYLWSRTQWDKSSHGRLKLTDGVIDGQADSSPSAYRCVWSNNPLTHFAGNHCFGPVGSECWATKLEAGKMNMDLFDRPQVSYLAAVDECAFYGAHLSSQRDFAENVPAGLPNGTNNYLWTSEANLYYCHQTIRWTNVEAGYTDSNQGGHTTYHDDRTSVGNRLRFRCTGVGFAAGANPNTVGDQTNPEYLSTTTQLKSTQFNKGASYIWDAITDCWSTGGHLASQRDYTEMIRTGLPNGAGASVYVWTSEWSREDHAQVHYWSGVDTQFTGYHSEYTTWHNVTTAVASKLAYRCAYYPLDLTYDGPPKVASCDSSAAFNCCNAGQYKCFISQKGGTNKSKMWADPQDRGALNYKDAVKNCAAEGGHLPSTRQMTELIRDGLTNGNGVDYLWTSDSVVHPNNSSHDYANVVRWSNVDTAWNATISSTNVSYVYKGPTDPSYRRRFRCVWGNELF